MADGSVTIKVLLESGDTNKRLADIEKALKSLGKDNPLKTTEDGAKRATAQMNLLKSASGASQKALSAIGKTALGFGKVAVGAIAGVATAVGALTISGGITRAMGINEAQAKMNQLGMDTTAVMASVKASVSGTKFALNDAAGAAVTLGSAGVAAGDDMTNALKSVASTASISGAEFSEIGAIYSKVAASGKLTTEVMNQLLERGVSVTAALSKSLGKSEAEIKQMVTAGKIDFKTFSDAMYAYLGDASMSANSTFSGAMANVRAALARVGEAFASPLLESLRQVFVALIPEIDNATAALKPLADGFASFISGAASQVVPHLKDIIGWFVNLATAVGDFFGGVVGSVDFEGFASALASVGGAIGDVFNGENESAATGLGSAIGMAINGLIPIIQVAAPLIQALATVFKFVAENVTWLVPVVLTLLAIMSGMGVVQQVAGFFSSFGGTVAQATPKLAANAVQLMQMGVAAIAFGAGILLAAAGMWVLVQAAIQLAQAGPEAGLALAGLVVSIAALVGVFALAAPALSAGAIGMVAFGAAVIMVGAGVMLACMGLTMLAGALPMVAAFGISAAGGLMALGASMLMAAPGALLLGVALLVVGAGALVAGAGMAVLGAATLAAFLGLTLCATPAAVLGPALLQGGAGALMMAAALVVIAAASLAAMPGLLALAAGIGGVAFALGLATPAFQGLAGALGGCASALSTCASSMMLIVVSGLLMSAAGSSAASGMALVGPAAVVAAGMLVSACQRMDRSVSDLAKDAVREVNRIKAAFAGMRLEIPSPTLGKMPHFSLSGRFDLEAGTVPSINVDWYATGGYASKATVLGGIGMGEAGGEGIVPLEGKHMYPLADAMSERMAGGGSQEVVTAIRALHKDLSKIINGSVPRKIKWNNREIARLMDDAKGAMSL